MRRGTRRTFGGKEVLGTRLLDLGLVRTSRDLAGLHRRLIEAGDAHPFGAWLDEKPHPPLRELNQVVERVRALFDDPLPQARQSGCSVVCETDDGGTNES